jgi:transcriptional regulator with XRE-family HTH domain
MESNEFVEARKKLGKTQKEMANLLGTSVKAVRSYEQGWRAVSTHVERQVFFLLSRLNTSKSAQKPCWVIKKCPPPRRNKCPAWEFQAGKLCWFINGTICDGEAQANWRAKMKICRKCVVLSKLL